MSTEPTEWRKSRHSGDDGGHCVELAALAGGTGIRDSKDPDGGYFVLDRGAFRALLGELKRR